MNKNIEKIVIDGIDVSTCHNAYHSGESMNIFCECGVQDVEHYNVMCSDNPECYYKQLQREKQKNEFLLDEIEAQNNIEDKYFSIVTRLAKRFKTFENADSILSEWIEENEKFNELWNKRGTK